MTNMQQNFCILGLRIFLLYVEQNLYSCTDFRHYSAIFLKTNKMLINIIYNMDNRRRKTIGLKPI
jgi:hypothetical protein